MPAILTHYTFALSAMPEELKPYEDIVRLGSQGPDTFMACGTIPWKKRPNGTKVREWGHTLHAISIVPVYGQMLKYAYESEDKDLLFAYIEGLFMHYCVDRLAHAYIFYRSGFDENGKLSGYWGWSHGAFEALLDKCLGHRKGTYGKLYRCILSDEERVAKISKMWAATSLVELSETDFYDAYRDFIAAEKMLYTPSGLKRPLFRLIGKYSTPWAQSHPRFSKKLEKMDVENLNHAVWFDPCTEQEHHESIDDLLEQAKADFADVRLIIAKARAGEDVSVELEAWTKNLNHDGRPIGAKPKRMDLCWEVVGKKSLLPR